MGCRRLWRAAPWRGHGFWRTASEARKLCGLQAFRASRDGRTSRALVWARVPDAEHDATPTHAARTPATKTVRPSTRAPRRGVYVFSAPEDRAALRRDSGR